MYTLMGIFREHFRERVRGSNFAVRVFLCSSQEWPIALESRSLGNLVRNNGVRNRCPLSTMRGRY